MFDYLGTKRHYGPVEVGTIARNNGYGSRLVRVVEKQGNDIVLESYGLLDYGEIRYAEKLKRIPAEITPADKHRPTFIHSMGKGQYYNLPNGSMAVYTPVTIVSRMVGTEDAARQGRNFRRSIERSRYPDVPYHRKWCAKTRYPKHELLNAAFLQGYDQA